MTAGKLLIHDLWNNLYTYNYHRCTGNYSETGSTSLLFNYGASAALVRFFFAVTVRPSFKGPVYETSYMGKHMVA